MYGRIVLKRDPKHPIPRIQWTIVNESKRAETECMVSEIQDARRAIEQTFDMASIWRKSAASIANKYGERGLSVRFCMNQIAFKSSAASTHPWMDLSSVKIATTTNTSDYTIYGETSRATSDVSSELSDKDGYKSDPGIVASNSPHTDARRALKRDDLSQISGRSE
jgi:hypothetical protein